MNSYDFFIDEFICFMSSYMNSGVPRFQMVLHIYATLCIDASLLHSPTRLHALVSPTAFLVSFCACRLAMVPPAVNQAGPSCDSIGCLRFGHGVSRQILKANCNA